MSIPSTIAEYLSCFSQELGDRILQIYPALQAPQDPVSERFKTLLRSPFAAQRLAGDGHREALASCQGRCGHCRMPAPAKHSWPFPRSTCVLLVDRTPLW